MSNEIIAAPEGQVGNHFCPEWHEGSEFHAPQIIARVKKEQAAERQLRLVTGGWARNAQRGTDASVKVWGENDPEPPVGTKGYNRVAWERRADGWHCTADFCEHCPCDWSEVVSWGGPLTEGDIPEMGDVA